MVITIDGLSVNGKTTLANRIASHYGFKCFNTGAVYRCYALYMKKNNLTTEKIEFLISELKKLTVSFEGKKVLLNDVDVTNEIFTIEISVYSTEIASTPEIKSLIREYQKSFIDKNDTVMEGRDIGTRIAPEADIKFYLYADKEVRAKRMQKSKNISFDEALKTIEQLDKMDINDKLFIKPEHAIEIDTSNLNLDDVYTIMINEIDKIVKL